MVVESALPDGNRTAPHARFNERNITSLIEAGGVVRMHARGGIDKPGILRRYSRRGGGRFKRLADADDALCARGAGASDYRVAVAVEGRVREVGVAVDEDGLPSAWRGHFRSIHRRIGAAT